MSDEKVAVPSHRSPAYPQHGLRKAIEFIKMVYDGAHTSEIGNEAVASQMGYKSMSGPATSAIGALKQYGLLEGRDPKLRVTQLALSILEPLNEAERRAAMLAAARMPTPFEELFREFGQKRPAENVLRSIAIRRYGFSGSGGDRFVDVYLDTLSFLETERAFESESGVVQTGLSVEPSKEGNLQAVAPSSNVDPIDLPQGERLEFRLTPEARAVVVLSGKVSQQAVEKLAAILTVLKDNYPGEHDLL